MKTWMFAMLSLVCIFAIATGVGETAPAAAPKAPEFGSCRWLCLGNSKLFTSASACASACSTECDEVC